jgi:hypothetical protein
VVAFLAGRERPAGKACGIPHLAKNERDVGHPATGGGDRAKAPRVGVAPVEMCELSELGPGPHDHDRGRCSSIFVKFDKI